METIRVDIVNPKAKTLVKGLADLDLIRIKKENLNPEFKELLNRLRIHSDEVPSME